MVASLEDVNYCGDCANFKARLGETLPEICRAVGGLLLGKRQSDSPCAMPPGSFVPLDGSATNAASLQDLDLDSGPDPIGVTE